MESLLDAVIVNLLSLALSQSHTLPQSATLALSISVSPAYFSGPPRTFSSTVWTKAWPEPPLLGSLKANWPGLASSQAVNSAQLCGGFGTFCGSDTKPGWVRVSGHRRPLGA